VQGDSVLAVPFDPQSLSATGPAVTLLKGVWISSWMGYADFAFSDNGTLVYVSGGPNPNKASLVSVDRAGRATPLVDARRAYRLPRISPDGRQVAVALVDQQVDIWTYDLLRKTPNRITDSPSWDAYPLWQPGMRWVAFSSMRDGPASIYRQDLHNGTVEKLVAAEYPTYPRSWSPDGRLLAYEEENPETGFDIWIYSLDSRSSKPFLRTPYNEVAAEFSPDGRFIAYESNEAGEQSEIYVRPYPEGNPRRKVSANGGTAPRWGTHGKELFYRVGGKVMALNVETRPDFVAATPRELFDGPYGAYDALPDGASFVMVKEMADGDPPTRINFVLNWFEERMRVAVRIDAQLAVPALAAQLAARRCVERDELLSTSDAANLIDADEMYPETAQESFRLFQVRSVLRKEDDARRQPHPAPHEFADSFNRSFEAALVAGNLIVDCGIERIEREMHHHSQPLEALNEIVPEDRRVGEDFAAPESDRLRVFDQPDEMRVDRRLAPDELQAAAAGRARIRDHAAPVAECHPLAERKLRTRAGVAVRAGEIAAAGDLQPQEVEAVQTAALHARSLERAQYRPDREVGQTRLGSRAL
jgi:Tol biopolymer transport system component